MNLPSALPLDKLSAGSLAGAFVVILTWFLKEYASVELPGEVQAAASLICGYVVSYLVPLSREEAASIARAYYRD